MKTTRSFAAPVTILGFMGLCLVYVSSYAALLRPDEGLSMCSDGICRPARQPNYRAGGEVAEQAFQPIQWVDEKVRPKYWKAER
jgi:hypothetical protein